MNEKRTTTDRRGNNQQRDRLFKCNRRIQPDRRLNNIQVEWIPINHINIYPMTRLVFSKP